ncbi:DUF4429 domain-containing protein [Streptomyces sp. A1136]|uniref:DUF4429 domain-containing protein n=1 Tax=Streptomyces sp. A1136 TaxID=2563102 RepID=UPI00109E6398|nr:DUF4429 domain-containing protein [Streptomyces sp. A1136]THA53790.1 DUF4429 domain-containing protein [Streptomyces sp. A1136]
MAEIIQKDGTWTFDGDAVRVVPGRDKDVGPLRQALGELSVPLHAIAGISYEPGRKAGRLRLRPRDGADPLTQGTAGRLPDTADPYKLAVDPARAAVAEYFVDEVRNALLLDRVDPGPTDAYLLPGPPVPVTAEAGDATVSFDGDTITLDWNWTAEDAKHSVGPSRFRVADVRAVEWVPAKGLSNGRLRFTLAGAQAAPAPKYDPYAAELFGFGKKELLTALVAAAVTVRLPHPAAPATPTAPATPSAPTAIPRPASTDHDVLLRRLRELGELHKEGVLTADEFLAAKTAILGDF